jgi:hypothetical protein
MSPVRPLLRIALPDVNSSNEIDQELLEHRTVTAALANTLNPPIHHGEAAGIARIEESGWRSCNDPAIPAQVMLLI